MLELQHHLGLVALAEACALDNISRLDDDRLRDHVEVLAKVGLKFTHSKVQNGCLRRRIAAKGFGNITTMLSKDGCADFLAMVLPWKPLSDDELPEDMHEGDSDGGASDAEELPCKFDPIAPTVHAMGSDLEVKIEAFTTFFVDGRFTKLITAGQEQRDVTFAETTAYLACIEGRLFTLLQTLRLVILLLQPDCDFTLEEQSSLLLALEDATLKKDQGLLKKLGMAVMASEYYKGLVATCKEFASRGAKHSSDIAAARQMMDSMTTPGCIDITALSNISDKFPIWLMTTRPGTLASIEAWSKKALGDVVALSKQNSELSGHAPMDPQALMTALKSAKAAFPAGEGIATHIDDLSNSMSNKDEEFRQNKMREALGALCMHLVADGGANSNMELLEQSCGATDAFRFYGKKPSDSDTNLIAQTTKAILQVTNKYVEEGTVTTDVILEYIKAASSISGALPADESDTGEDLGGIARLMRTTVDLKAKCEEIAVAKAELPLDGDDKALLDERTSNW